MSPEPRCGQIWLVALGAARKGEIGKTRPVVVVSVDQVRSGSKFDLISVVPLSASRPARLLRPRIPATDGLEEDSIAMCDAVQSISQTRFLEHLAMLPDHLMAEIRSARATIEGWL